MIHGVRYIRQDVSYISKKHNCPICNSQLNVIKVSKIINSNSEEAKELPSILPKTVIGSRRIKFRSYNAVGNIKWIWKEFKCSHCQHRFTVEQLKQIEAAPQEHREKLISSFDEPQTQIDSEAPAKKNNKTKLALLITIPTVLALSFVILLFIFLNSSSDFVDTNGPDNFALTEITREDILGSSVSAKTFMSSKKSSGARSQIVGTKFRECDRDNISVSYGRFHGVAILQATKIFEDSLRLNISSSIESGNAEIVIIIDGEYYCSVNINKTQSVFLKNVSGKEVIIKLAGEDAKIKVDITRTY